MAEMEQSAKSKRDMFNERLRAKRPELNVDDEDAYYGAISEDYDNYENENRSLSEENEGYKAREKEIVNFATANKNNGLYFDDLMQGKDIFESAVERHGYDAVLEYLQSEEAREKYRKNDEKYRKTLEQNKALNDEAEKNRVETDKKLNEAIAAGKFSEEDCKSAIDFLMDINDGLNVNVCEVEWVEMALKAKNHDADVDAARKEGRLDGVNEGVEKQMAKRKKSAAPANAPSMPIGTGGKGGTRSSSGGNSLTSALFGK